MYASSMEGGSSSAVERRSPKPNVVSSSLATPATGLGFLLKKKPQQRKFSFKIELEVNSNSIFVYDFCDNISI